MVTIADLTNALESFGTIVYCNYNGEDNVSFVVVLENVTGIQADIDIVCDSFISVEYSNKVPSTLEENVYKVNYDNFPNQ